MISSSWQKQSDFQLSDNGIHVWRIDLPDFYYQLAELKTLLDPNEYQRADRFYFKKDHDAFVTAHGVLRLILSAYLKVDPKAISYEKASHGKPFLKNRSDIKFNLSHSKQMALCAVGLHHELGIDVEYIDKPVEQVDLARRFFTSEEAAIISALSDKKQKQAFFKTWTQKEAFIKAIGLGLSFPLKKFVVDADPNQPGGLVAVDDSSLQKDEWAMQVFQADKLYLAALAAHCSKIDIRFFQYAASLAQNSSFNQ